MRQYNNGIKGYIRIFANTTAGTAPQELVTPHGDTLAAIVRKAAKAVGLEPFVFQPFVIERRFDACHRSGRRARATGSGQPTD